ncbi:MAG TPA: cupredoxin domain-containing protein [Gaiellaceae bacterium]|nr:cupredoxin domain-containing protein [Gaiellaceae bacterium]
MRLRGRAEPCLIRGTAGRPIRVTFRREETSPASEQVVFPDLGRSITLPPFADVTVELLPRAPGTYGFVDASGALRGALVVPER